MPYIEARSRFHLTPYINNLSEKIDTIGKLNYCITRLCLNFLKRSTISYTSLNEIPDVLECVKAEFYRKILTPYEDKKCVENAEERTKFASLRNTDKLGEILEWIRTLEPKDQPSASSKNAKQKHGLKKHANHKATTRS